MKKMLVIEDDSLSQDLIARIFKNDFEIDTCESAEEFYEKYSSINYSIIIMDISIKGNTHGLELTKEIKALPAFSHTPILCLTAHAQSNIRRNAIEAGVDVFFIKPIPNKVLKEAVTSLLA